MIIIINNFYQFIELAQHVIISPNQSDNWGEPKQNQELPYILAFNLIRFSFLKLKELNKVIQKI